MTGANEPMMIIKIGAEGGSIKVVARTSADGVPEYSVRLRDQTLTFLSKEEAGAEIRTSTPWSVRWDDVVTALGRWPWPMLVPLYVHSDYADRVLSAVKGFKGRDGRPVSASAIERWTEVCRSHEGE